MARPAASQSPRTLPLSICLLIVIFSIGCYGVGDEQLNELNWMSRIDDNTPLSQLSIPGTHDSMALYCGKPAVCQRNPIIEQLRAGIRFLDIRFQCILKHLPIVHGCTPQFDYFDSVAEDVSIFLRAQNQETVIMRLKIELFENSDAYTVVMNTLKKHFVIWWKGESLPTMSDARGKLIILQEFKGNRLGITYNSDLLDISDDYKVDNINTKWNNIRNHLSLAINGNMNKPFLTFTSGTGISFINLCVIGANCVLPIPNVDEKTMPPIYVAEQINNFLLNFLTTPRNLRSNARLGIIAMDFPSAELIRKIISFNSFKKVRRHSIK